MKGYYYPYFTDGRTGKEKVLVKIAQLGSEVKLSLQNVSSSIPLKVSNKNHLDPHYAHFSLSLFI